jgi:hypothetical protein
MFRKRPAVPDPVVAPDPPLLSRGQAERQVETLLSVRMVEVLRTVAVDLPPFGRPVPPLAEIARAAVQVRHASGAAFADYLVEALGDLLSLHLQLNVWRFVVIYRVPAVGGVDGPSLMPRLERWQRGAEHAGWQIGWRETEEPGEPLRRQVEVYAYAHAGRELLASELEQMFWLTDIAQMTRAFMLEAQRCRIRLSPRELGWDV